MRNMYGRLGTAISIASLFAGLSALAGCVSKDAPPKGELVLVLNTDMSIPKDISEVGIHVDVDGRVVWDRAYPVGIGHEDTKIPATLGILAGKESTGAVHLRVWGRQGDKVRVLRDVITTVPAERAAMLRVPLQWLCDGTAVETASGLVSTCGDNKTCVTGSCVSAEIDSSALPDYAPASVFGGASSDGTTSGSCFDTLTCFSQGRALVVDDDTCTVEIPDGLDHTSLGLVFPPGGPGVCGGNGCIVPLDLDPNLGWSKQGTKWASLPKAVCDKLRTGDVLAVLATSACDPKTPDIPMCGPWSSVGADAGTFGDVQVPTEVGPEDGGPSDGDIQDVHAEDVVEAGDADASDASDAADAQPTDAGDGGSSDGSSPPVCGATGDADAGLGGLCVTFDHEPAGLILSNPWSDGKGVLHILVKTNDVVDPEDTSHIVGSYQTYPGQLEDITQLKPREIPDLPSEVYILAYFSDLEGPDAGQVDPSDGPMWVGGIDFSKGMRSLKLNRHVLTPGIGTTVKLHMVAGRRVIVPVMMGLTQLPPDFNGQGHVSWLAYKEQKPNHGTPRWGSGSLHQCVDFLSGPQTVDVPGLIFGGPSQTYYFIAALEDANKSSLDQVADAWTTPGVVVSCHDPNGVNCTAETQDSFPAGDLIDYGTIANAVTLTTPISGPGMQTRYCDQDGGVPDGGVPDGSGCTAGTPCNTGLFGKCANGHISCTTGQPLCLPDTAPTVELCNGLDDDCDGVPDDIIYAQKTCVVPGQAGVCAQGMHDCRSATESCYQTTTGAPEIAGNSADDDCDGLTDICTRPSASSTKLKADGTCEILGCNVGWVDLDGDPEDGCEYNCTPTQPSTEVCDGVDNDCNGKIDDMAQTALNNDCQSKYTSASNVQDWACVAGLCRIELCLPGYSEQNGSLDDGCETPTLSCQQNAQPETCDGVDNNCDGIVDNVPNEGTVACWDLPGTLCHDSASGLTWDPPSSGLCDGNGSLQGACHHGTVQCIGGAWMCVGAVHDHPEVCDGLDNDCDGTKDEYPGPNGNACGILRDGTWNCNVTNHVFECTLASSPQAEICNGVDDDGNSITDDVSGLGEPCGKALGPCVPGTIQCVNNAGVWSKECVGGTPASPEIPDNAIDDDCDGQTDEP